MSPGDNGTATEEELREAAVRQAVEEQQLVVVRRRVHCPPEESMPAVHRRRLGVVMLLLPPLLITQLVALWPSALAATASAGRDQPTTVWLFGLFSTTLSPDGALIMLVVLVGALTSLAEVSFRFVANAGRGELTTRWTWGYLLRPTQGAVLALTAYFALRGGLLGTSSPTELNPYGLAAIAALVGLFTRQAFQKLKEVFNGLWGVEDLDADIEPVKDPSASGEQQRPPRRSTRRTTGARSRQD